MTGGFRYTYEEKDGIHDVRSFCGVAPMAVFQADQQSILRAKSYSADDGDGSASGRVNISYDLIDGVMAYASYPNGSCPIERMGSGTAQCDCRGRGYTLVNGSIGLSRAALGSGGVRMEPAEQGLCAECDRAGWQ